MNILMQLPHLKRGKKQQKNPTPTKTQIKALPSLGCFTMFLYITKNHLANAERIHDPFITKDEQLSL